MEYEEEPVHNVLAVAWNAVISVAFKFVDNIVCVVIALVIMMQPTVDPSPATKLPYTLLKAPKALVIKQVCILSRKLKDSKLWPKLGLVQVQEQY